MTDIVLFCTVIIVPLLLALLVMDLAAGSRPRFHADDHTLASAGIFWDRPARSHRHVRAQSVRQDPELGGAPELARRPVTPPADSGAPALPVVPGAPERLPAV